MLQHFVIKAIKHEQGPLGRQRRNRVNRGQGRLLRENDNCPYFQRIIMNSPEKGSIQGQISNKE